MSRATGNTPLAPGTRIDTDIPARLDRLPWSRWHWRVVIALGIVRIPIYARVLRSSVLSVKEHEYIEAVRALALRPLRILFHHVLPNCMAPIIITSPGHGLSTGMSVTVAGVLGNTAANGVFTITVVDADQLFRELEAL